MNYAPIAGGYGKVIAPLGGNYPRHMGIRDRQSGVPVSYVQVKTAYAIAAMTMDSPNREGGTLFVFYMDGNGGTAKLSNDAKVSDSNGNTYEQLMPPVAWLMQTNVQVWVARNIKPGTNTVTVVRASAGSTDPGTYVVEVAGAATCDHPIFWDFCYSRSTNETLEVKANQGALCILFEGTEQSVTGAAPTGWTTISPANGHVTVISTLSPPQPGIVRVTPPWVSNICVGVLISINP